MAKKTESEKSPDSTPRNKRSLPPAFEAAKWQPGESGNPGGRKKKWITEVVDELLERKFRDPVERAKFQDAIWEKLLSHRMIAAMTLSTVWDRHEGKQVTPVELQGEIDIKAVIEAGRKRLADSEDALILDAEEVPQLPDHTDSTD